MQQQRPSTVKHSRISSLMISRRLTRPKLLWDIQFGGLRDRKWARHPKIFGWALRTSGWTPLSKFLNPPLLCECSNPTRGARYVCDWEIDSCTDWGIYKIIVHWVAVTSFYPPALANREEEETKMCYFLLKCKEAHSTTVWPKSWYVHVCMHAEFHFVGEGAGGTFVSPWKSLHHCKLIQKSCNMKCIIISPVHINVYIFPFFCSIHWQSPQNHCQTVCQMILHLDPLL